MIDIAPHELLRPLGEQLEVAGERFELVVVGGSALVAAARWTRTHDPSPPFRDQLERALRHLGVDDVDLGPA